MIKVISGKYRSRLLATPEHDTEPTKNRVREALFSAINNEIVNSCCLDLFSGSGALGIEAMSRGASICFFNDLSTEAYNIIIRNLQSLNINNCDVSNLNYLECLLKLSDKLFDVVFLDPPYSMKESYNATIRFLIDHKMINNNSVIVLEYSDSINVDEYRFDKVKVYKYGKSNIMILRGMK